MLLWLLTCGTFMGYLNTSIVHSPIAVRECLIRMAFSSPTPLKCVKGFNNISCNSFVDILQHLRIYWISFVTIATLCAIRRHTGRAMCMFCLAFLTWRANLRTSPRTRQAVNIYCALKFSAGVTNVFGINKYSVIVHFDLVQITIISALNINYTETSHIISL